MLFSITMKNIFNELDNSNIEYLIERNYEYLPNYTVNDIDILVKEQDVNNARKLINSIVVQNGYINVINIHSLGTYKLVYINRNINEDIIRLDLNYMLHYKGVKYLDINKVINNRVKYKEFYIPASEEEVVLSLFTNYINNGKVKDKYKESIYENIDILLKYKNISINRNIYNMFCGFISNKDWKSVEEMIGKIRINIIKNGVVKKNNIFKLSWLLFLRVIKFKINLFVINEEFDKEILVSKLRAKGIESFFIKRCGIIEYTKLFVKSRFSRYIFILQSNYHTNINRKLFNLIQINND